MGEASTPKYRIRGAKATITIPAYSAASQFVIASVCQHARRAGKADAITLPECALTLWDRIPDEVPRTLRWVNPRPPKPALLIAVICALGVAAIADVWFLFRANDGWAGVALLYIGMGVIGAAAILREALLAAVEFEMDDRRFQARTPRAKAYMEWTEVSFAQWTTGGLLIRGADRRDQVLLRPGNDNDKLVLAVIRRLREVGHHLLQIPQPLRAHQPADSANAPTAAEVRITRFETLALPGIILAVGGMLLAAAICDPRVKSIWPVLAAPGLAFCAVLAYAAGRSHAFCVDESGITKRFLWWRKSAQWEKVADYRVRPRKQGGVTMQSAAPRRKRSSAAQCAA